MEKFKGEVAYALLCPCCDENILCGIDDSDEDDGGIRVLMYPSHKDADRAIDALMGDDRNENDEILKKRPNIIMVRIVPIKYQLADIDKVIESVL